MSEPAGRAIVTGGTGIVGRFIVEGLLREGYRVTVAGRSAPPANFFGSPVDFLPFDLGRLDLAAFRNAAADCDLLVHAAFSHVPGRYRGGEGDDPDAFLMRNRDASLALFEAAAMAGTRLAVFLSSRAVYGGAPRSAPIDEEVPAEPDTLYGEMKRDVEKGLLDLRARGLASTSLRATGVYGPAGTDGSHKWRGLFADYLAGREIAPRAGTEVHGDDVAAAVRLLSQLAPEELPPVLNVSDILLDRHDLLAIVRDATGTDHPLPERAATEGYGEMATTRLRSLGWEPGGFRLLERTVRGLLAADPSQVR